MSFAVVDALSRDGAFGGRNRACLIEQATIFRGDGRPQIAAVAISLLRGENECEAAFLRLAAAGPGIADKATTADGWDQTLITDADILALAQANFPIVADLYFTDDGTPKERTIR